MRFMNIAARAFGAPLLLAPKPGLVALESLGGYLRQRIHGDDAMSVARLRMMEDDDGREPARVASLPFGIFRLRDKPYAVIDGVAVIPIEGTLVNRLGSLNPYCGMTGYDGLRTLIVAALHDPEVRAIVLYVDSPGGEVAGCFDLADDIAAWKETKPIYAVVDGMACSAAYALSAACTKVAASETAIVGSIGVIVAHYDFSAFLEEEGVKVSLIYAGPRKADGNPYQPLPDDVRASFQAEIDAVYSMFVERVAAFRSIAANAVRALESRADLAGWGVANKLVDGIAAPADALAGIIAGVA